MSTRIFLKLSPLQLPGLYNWPMSALDFSLLQRPLIIQNVRIPGRVMLAPMDGYSDSPFRSLCRQFGAALCPSEFINAIDIVNGHPHLKYKTFFSQFERPFCFQLYDDDIERMEVAAQKLVEYTPDLLDINMGCSARNVSNRGAGAGLLRDPQKIAQISAKLVKSLTVPVTAKIRLGWDDASRNYLEVAHILQENGISAITVHARTRKQEYRGSADWSAIAEIKSSVFVPVIGNGDVKSLADAQSLMLQTGCDAVMIGRAAFGNPWVFSGIPRNLIPETEFFQVIQQHLTLMGNLYGDRLGSMLFRRHLSKYLSDWTLSLAQKITLFAIESPVELMQYLHELVKEDNSNVTKI
jgi:tRNA-dihydrouridine synthase B